MIFSSRHSALYEEKEDGYINDISSVQARAGSYHTHQPLHAGRNESGIPQNEAATAVNNCSLVLAVVRLFMHGNGKQDPDKGEAPESEAAP